MNAELFGGHSLFFFTLNNGMVNLPVDVVVVLRRRTAVVVVAPFWLMEVGVAK
jgi:hypothetical protein